MRWSNYQLNRSRLIFLLISLFNEVLQVEGKGHKILPSIPAGKSLSASSQKLFPQGRIATIAIDVGWKKDTIRMMSAFYDTRPLLFGRKAEVVVNGLTKESFSDFAVSCVIARYPKSSPFPEADRKKYDTTFPDSKKTPQKTSKFKNIHNDTDIPQQHTLQGKSREEFELVYEATASRAFEKFTWSEWGATILSCPIEHDHHQQIFSENNRYRFFVLLIPSKKVDWEGEYLFSEHWFPIELTPNHPKPPLLIHSRRKSSNTREGVSIDEFLAPYTREPDPSAQPSIAVCTQPCFGEFPHLTEWFEYYKMMGVTKVFLYNYRIDSEKTIDVLARYQKEGLVEVIDYQHSYPSGVIRFASRWGWWDSLPQRAISVGHGMSLLSHKKITKERFFSGEMPNPIIPPVTRRMTWAQSAAITDCLFRSVGRFRWAFNVDFDELVVPNDLKNLKVKSLFGFWLHQTVRKNHLQTQITSFPNFIPAVGIRNRFYCPFAGNCTPEDKVKMREKPDCNSPVAAVASSQYLCKNNCDLHHHKNIDIEEIQKFVSFISPFRTDHFLKVGRTKYAMDPILTTFPSIHNIKGISIERFGIQKSELVKKSDAPSIPGELGMETSLTDLASYAIVRFGQDELQRMVERFYPTNIRSIQQSASLLFTALNGYLMKKGNILSDIKNPIDWVLLEGNEADLHHLRKEDSEPCSVYDFYFLNTYGDQHYSHVQNKL